jgi:hypothetical protein
LISHNDEEVTQLLSRAAQFEDPRAKFKGLATMHMIAVQVDHAVSIKEQSFFAPNAHEEDRGGSTNAAGRDDCTLHCITQCMPSQNVILLNPRCVIGRNLNQNI